MYSLLYCPTKLLDFTKKQNAKLIIFEWFSYKTSSLGRQQTSTPSWYREHVLRITFNICHHSKWTNTAICPSIILRYRKGTERGPYQDFTGTGKTYAPPEKRRRGLEIYYQQCGRQRRWMIEMQMHQSPQACPLSKTMSFYTVSNKFRIGKSEVKGNCCQSRLIWP